MRQVALWGGIVGIVISALILTSLAFGVSGVLKVHDIDLMYVLWPSSIILTIGWRTTVTGIATTMLSVAINFVTYAGIALILHVCLRSFVDSVRHGSAK